jgi:SAM-dependent methyltransferase/predicted Ser/Thr protein kinase
MSGKPSLALDASAAGPGPGADPALADARLERSWPSPLDPARRYGIAGNLFFKIALRDAADAPARRQDLRAEADLLRRCQGIPGIPGFVAWTQSDAARVLVLQRLDAQPLNQLEIGWLRLGAVLLALAALVVRLAWRGVSHDDLRPENILLGRAGRIHLIDFDQASSGGFAGCLARSLLGLRLARGPVSNSLWAPLRERVQTSLPPAVLRTLKGARLSRRRARVAPLPPLPPAAAPALRELHAAWRLAAASGASAPGVAVAYHELEWQGTLLPGERPWAARWQTLRGITPYRGRRVLELGCNLGLLSSFLLKDAGAAAALAVDRNPLILEAAARAAAALGVAPSFRALDLDRDPDWEAELAAFRPDVVFALSLFHWVGDQARLLAFLGRCDELIYEGHASARTEWRRLRAAGFETITLIATSERGRAILHCRRQR